MTMDVKNIDSFPIARDLKKCPYDPPAEYAALRHEDPVHPITLWSGNRAWLLTGYDDCKSVLTDTRFSAVPTRQGYPALSPGHLKQAVEDTFVRMDPPEHTRIRRMFVREFLPGKMEKMRPDIERVTNRLLDRVIERGPPVDMLSSFSGIFPASIMCLLLDAPLEDMDFFKTRTEIQFRFDSTPEQVEQAANEMLAYVKDLFIKRSKNPGEDIISRVAVEHVAKGDIELDVAVQNIRRILEAGHETTANQIALSILLLIDSYPEQWAMLAEKPELARSATEELLRYLTVAHRIPRRVAIEDVELRGKTIKAGEGILPLIASANRDETSFPDPDRLDITREPREHVAFSWGIHQCLGQTLARVEMQSAFSILPKRFPDLRLNVPLAEIEFDESMLAYGIRSLPVTWTNAR
ncbi:cytochrome P450 [Parasphingorhabdus sp.]|uniref:cytochrome P450 n=1 Tax=Parasphingorhabdus sp. TaxID=2709688 RepID=UPI003A92F5AE